MKNSRNYKKNISVKNKSFSTLTKELNKIFNALPKYIKEPLKEDKNKYISTIARQMLQIEKSFQPYNVFKQLSQFQSGRTPQALTIYSRFRNEAPRVYSAYNSYMFRRGYSAAQYFYKNAEFSADGSVIDVYLDLPDGKYSLLHILIDMSVSNDLEAEIT